MEKDEWEAYLVKHGESLARLLARLPCLTILTVYRMQDDVVYQAILLQPCRYVASIEFQVWRSPCLEGNEIPWGPFGKASPLHLALAKGHLPCWSTLAISNDKEATLAARALRAGHLTHVKELQIEYCNDKPGGLRSLLEAFKAHEGKLEALELEIHRTGDLVTRALMHEFLSSPVCSNLYKLRLRPCDNDTSSSAMVFMSEYLRNGRAGGRASLRELHFFFLEYFEDVSCLTDALVLGGGRETAPNLEEVRFEYVWNEYITEQLGPDLFGRGALATLATLQFHNLDFDNEGMSGLMDGFRQSRHEGRTLKKLVFDWCHIPFAEDDYEDMWQFDGEVERSMYLSDARKASLALIAGLRDGLFPNLEELLTPGVMFLVQEAAELVELVRGGAPCARTLKRIVMSKEFLARRSIKPLQAVLPHATVVRA